MKKKFFAFLVCLLILLPLCFACSAGAPIRDKMYLDLKLNENCTAFTAKERYTYLNKGKTALDSLYFYFYPAAFSDPDKLPIEELYFNSAYPRGMSLAEISVAVNAEFEQDARAPHMFKVKLSAPLKAGNSTTLDFEFSSTIPENTLRFGRGDLSVNLSGFYFVPAYHDGEEWRLYDYYAIGDPFVNESFDAEVKASYPAGYKMVSTGKESGGKINAPRTRDFAMVLSKTGKITKGRTDGGIEVSYLATRDKNPAATLNAAISALDAFSALFGAYDYPTFSLADVDFLEGGMEYTSLVFITSAATGEERKRIVVHEAAHQWWYNAVGGNQVDESWTDEALAEFSTLLYYRERGDGKTSDLLLVTAVDNWVTYYTVFRKFGIAANAQIDRPLSGFTSSMEYSVVVYGRGLLMFDAISTAIGKANTLAALKDYCKTNKNTVATGKALIAAFTKHSPAAAALFETWLAGKAVVGGNV